MLAGAVSGLVAVVKAAFHRAVWLEVGNGNFCLKHRVHLSLGSARLWRAAPYPIHGVGDNSDFLTIQGIDNDEVSRRWRVAPDARVLLCAFGRHNRNRGPTGTRPANPRLRGT